MKTKAFLLIAITVLNSSILAAQQPPQVIPSGKPTIIPVPTKNHTLNLTSQGKNGIVAKTRKMSAPVNIPLPSGGDEGGLMYFVNYNAEQGLALNSIACGYRDRAGNL